MELQLPKAIAAYFDAERDRDHKAIAAAFIEGGIVRDKGQIHKGRAAIRQWMDDVSKQYTYTVEPFSIMAEDGRILVTAHTVGTFPGSPIDLRLFFVLSGDKIAELEITV